MRVVVIGGTRFIGRQITEQLVNRGDEVLVVHRGAAEPENWVRCRHWVGQILAATDHDAVLGPGSGRGAAADLVLTGRIPQDLLAANDKARRVLGWEPGNQTEAVRRSVRWHLAHPPAHPDTDFTADDRALQ